MRREDIRNLKDLVDFKICLLKSKKKIFDLKNISWENFSHKKKNTMEFQRKNCLAYK